MEAVIAAIEQEIAQEEAIHEQAMSDLNGLLTAAKDLNGQRATDGAAPEAPPSEEEDHNDETESDPEAAPEPDVVNGVCQGCGATEAAECACRRHEYAAADLTGGEPPAPVGDRYRTRTRAPGQQAKGADAARQIGEENRAAVLRYLVDAASADRGAAAGAGWRTPREIREATGLSKDKVRKHCVALMSDGLADMRGHTKDRRYRATKKARTNPQEGT